AAYLRARSTSFSPQRMSIRMLCSSQPNRCKSRRNAAMAGRWMLRRAIHEHPDAPNLLGLLRAGRERPCNGRASNDFDEIAASHCLHQGRDLRRIGRDYSRDLRSTKWGSEVSLRGSNYKPPMSALGQKQTLERFRLMSA